MFTRYRLPYQFLGPIFGATQRVNTNIPCVTLFQLSKFYAILYCNNFCFGLRFSQPPVTTAVMKVNLHCQGCIHKIRKVVTKTIGYQEMSIDEQKDQVTVKGTMDMKALADALVERLKRPVEMVQPKKDNAEKKGGGGGGAKKEKGSGGEEGKTGGDSGGNDGGVGQLEENRIQYVPLEYPNTYMYGYGMGYPVEQYQHAPQMFSDENPNACSVM